MVLSSHGSSASRAMGGGGAGEMGLGLLGDTGTIKVEHVFTFNLGDKWERPLRKSIGQWMDLCMEYAESFRFIAVGIGSYFFLLGISKVIEAGNYPRSDDGRGGTVRKTLKVKEKKDGDNASVRSSRTNRSSKKIIAPPPTSALSIPTTITLGDGGGATSRVGFDSTPTAVIPEESEPQSDVFNEQE